MRTTIIHPYLDLQHTHGRMSAITERHCTTNSHEGSIIPRGPGTYKIFKYFFHPSILRMSFEIFAQSASTLLRPGLQMYRAD